MLFQQESCINQCSDDDDQNQMYEIENSESYINTYCQEQQQFLNVYTQESPDVYQPKSQYFDSNNDQDHEISNQSQKSTAIAGGKKKPKQTKPIKSKPVFQKEPIVRNVEKKETIQQSETKNLPKFYANSILNRLENLNRKCQIKDPQIKKKISKFEKKPCSLKTLGDMLQDPIINKISIEYITSFDFLDQLLGSERLQDVRPPIKYLNKLYQGCLNQHALKQWKDS